MRAHKLICLMTAAGLALAGAAFAETVALVGGTIHPVSGDVIQTGTVVFTDGKITAVGANVEVPAGARQVDVSGEHVYPGMIAANTVLGLVEVSSVRGTRDMAEVGNINANSRAMVALNADSWLIPVARANGILTVLTATTGGVVSGTSAIWNLDGWNWEEMTLVPDAGLHIRWPSMVTSSGWWVTKSEEEQKKDREKKLKELKEAFDDARAYMKAREAMANGGAHQPVDVRWEAMIPALKGEMKLFIHADEYQQIDSAIKFADEEGFEDVVIVGGMDSWRLADELAAANIPVVLESANGLPRRNWEAYDEAFTVARKLHEAGVLFCFSMGGSRGDAGHMRSMPYQAGHAAAFGLPKEEALKGLTLNAARILGVDDRLGSIEVGKDANLIVTDGDPVEIMTHINMAFIGGADVTMESRHTGLFDKYRNRPRTDGKESRLTDAY